MTAQGRAWGWTAALRQGTTTSWREWQGDAPPGPGRLPGAQQLGVLLRLNRLAADRGRTLPTAVADRVLAGDLAGRGRSELPLVGVDDARDYGPRPVDPDELAAEELLRVATALIADDVAATAAAPAAPGSTIERVRRLGDRAGQVAQAARGRRRTPPFVVVGVPWRVAGVEQALRAMDREPGVPGRTPPVAYLLAEDLGTAMAHAWTARSFDQGGHGWPGFVRAAASGGRVPPRADLAAMARAARRRWGASQVRVVLDTARLAAELGVASVDEPAPLGADAIELARLVGEPLGLLVDERARPGLLRAALEPRLAGRGGALPTIAPQWSTWLRSHAERVHHELAAGGYPVLGDLAVLLDAEPAPAPVVPSADGALTLALELLLDPVVAPGGAR